MIGTEKMTNYTESESVIVFRRLMRLIRTMILSDYVKRQTILFMIYYDGRHAHQGNTINATLREVTPKVTANHSLHHSKIGMLRA